MTGIAACVVADCWYLLELELGAAAMTAEALRSSPGGPPRLSLLPAPAMHELPKSLPLLSSHLSLVHSCRTHALQITMLPSFTRPSCTLGR